MQTGKFRNGVSCYLVCHKTGHDGDIFNSVLFQRRKLAVQNREALNTNKAFGKRP